MPQFSANLSLLFTELDFLDRFQAAAEAGFTAVEFQFPYSYPVETILERLRWHRLELVLHNLPAGNWEAGERGIACLPDRVNEFRAGVDQAIAYAAALNCPRLNCLAGVAPVNIPTPELEQTLVENLRYAAAEVLKAGIILLTEPVNILDIPGFLIHHSTQALELIDRTNADNLRLQYDVYHMQIMEGNLAYTLEKHLDQIGHIQIADVPGRHEPGTGEINFPFLFDHLDRIGYRGWVGCEYRPLTTTRAGLGWLNEC